MGMVVRMAMVTIIPVRIVMLLRPWWLCRGIAHHPDVITADMEDVDGKKSAEYFLKKCKCRNLKSYGFCIFTA